MVTPLQGGYQFPVECILLLVAEGIIPAVLRVVSGCVYSPCLLAVVFSREAVKSLLCYGLLRVVCRDVARLRVRIIAVLGFW